MKRVEFIQGFVDRRKASYNAAVDAGEMRVSEAVMGMADAERAAASLWRKHRKSYSGMKLEQVFTPEVPKLPVPVGPQLVENRVLNLKPKPPVISGNLSIGAYIQCGKCLMEVPPGTSAAEFAKTSIGFTNIGLQVWCNRHNCNVMHIDFQGHKHPANTKAPK